MLLDARQLLEPKPGFFYEPRVLWGSSYVAPTGLPGASVYASPFQTDAFYNGSRWPIVLTHLILLAQGPCGGPMLQMAIGAAQQLQIQGRGTARFARGTVPLQFDPVTAQEPLSNLTALPGNTLANDGLPGYLPTANVARWDFQNDLILPAKAFVDFSLSGRIPTVAPTNAVTVTGDVNLHASSNSPALFPGNALTLQSIPIAQLTTAAAAQRYNEQVAQLAAVAAASSGDYSFTPPNPMLGAFGGTQTQVFPGNQVLTSFQVSKQQANFEAPVQLGGFSVSFDETQLNQAVRLETGPLSCTTLARARTRNGGTQAFWWRDGAPLAICTPTFSPGLVNRFSRPIALQPGEALDASLPSVLTLLLQPKTCSVGEGAVIYVSACGYAAVEA